MKKLFFFASAVALLASCSKDLTEDVYTEAPSISGNNKITASYASGDATRSHLDRNEKNKLEAAWDNGDALGVLAAVAGDESNASFGYAGNNSFDGDLQSVKGRKFILYYPWDQSRKISTDGTLNLIIPATQKYNHKASVKGNTDEGGHGSFSSGVVPSVAYAEIGEKEDKATATLEAKMQPIASYFSVPFIGIGKVGKMTMSIKVGTTNQRLAGTIPVNVLNPTKDESGKEVTFFSLSSVLSSGSSNLITLDCGDGVDLDQEKPSWFTFVVPANMNMKNKVVFTFTVYGVDDATEGTTYTYEMAAVSEDRTNGRNNNINLSGSKPFVWVEAGKYLVQNADQFIEYAYAASVEDGFNLAYDEMKNDDELKTALITKDITFGSDYQYVAKENDNFSEAVAKWYEEGVTTLGAKKSMKIEGSGAVVDGVAAPVSIIGLAIKSNTGIFSDEKTHTIENVILDGFEVTSDQTSSVPFITGDVTKISGSDFTVKGGKMTATKANMVTYIYTSQLKAEPFKIEAYPENISLYSDILFVNEDITLNDEYTTPNFRFGAVQSTWNLDTQGAIVTVSGEASARAIVAKTVIEKGKWFSVMDATTSYWTGMTANAVNTDKFLTAEELAFVVANHEKNDGKGTTLTNDLNLMGDAGKMWPVTSSGTGYIIKGNKKTLKNALVSTANAVAKGYYSLFGTAVRIYDLNVESLTIELPNAISNARVAGIAYSAAQTSENIGINVKGLTFVIPEGTTFENNAVGGLFALNTEGGNYAEGCSVANVSGIPADVAYGDIYGAVNVKLGQGSDEKDVIVIPGNTFATKPIGEIRCTAGDNMQEKQSTHFNIDYAQADVDFDIFRFISTEDNPIKDGHTLYIKWADTNKEEAFEYKKSEQVVDDFTLSEALVEAAKVTTPVIVSVKAGKYSAETLVKLSANVVLECAKGTVFKGVAKADIKGATIKGAAFESDVEYTSDMKNDWSVAALTGGINGKFVDCTFKGYNAARGCYASGDTIVFEGCTFEATGFVSNGSNYGGYAFHIDSNSKPVTFTDCTFKGRTAFGGSVTVTMSGCEFVGNGKYNTLEMWGSATLKDCEFTKGNATVIDEIRVETTKDAKIIFDTCTVNGIALTYEDVKGFNTNVCTIK